MIVKFEKLYFGYEQKDHTRYMEMKRGTLPKGHPAGKLLSSYPEYFYDGIKHKKEHKLVEINEKSIFLDVRRRALPKKKHLLRVPLCIDSGHPYMGVLLRFDENSVSLRYKLKLIAKFRHKDRNTRMFEDYYRVSPRTVLGYKKPLNESEFDLFFKTLNNWGNSHFSRWDIVP